MAGETPSRPGDWFPPGAAPSALLPRSLVLRALFGCNGPRLIRAWRLLFSGVWLVYVIQPVGSLFHHHHGLLYIGGACAISAVFCVLYLYLIARWDVQRRRTLAALIAALAALAALACVVYGGAKWNALWIYVSAACGLAFADRRTAMRTVGLAGACYLLFSWIGHDDTSDFLATLLPVLLVGFATIGFRMQINLTRELTAARETVAQLAASEERLRMARDMHDLTGQSLSVITLKSELAGRLLSRLPDSPGRDRVRDEVEQVAAVSRQTLHDIREAISGYRRPTLAVEAITARTALEAAGIAPHEDTALTLLSGTFDPDVEAALAWCLREAATNVIRHSGAENCHIGLTRRGGTVSLTVRDDGTGAAPDYGGTGNGGTGLHGMSERLNAVGGQLEIMPGTGSGFCLTASVPVSERVTVTV